ncbi:MAG: hypothetical protein HOM21_07290 [Halobacteriovoraceae bacterium]|nr:hypothetical protein [Halobacteriovoraceae bacterium]
MGVEGNDSYPGFKYPMEPQKVYGKYGTFLDRYYQVFYNFVSKVLENVSPDDYYIGQWAKHISQHLPGFPGEKEIFEGDNLVKAVTMFMWDVTVSHTVDHYNYGGMNIRKIPLRLRQEPPKQGSSTVLNRKKLTKFWDYGKYKMCQILFFRPTSVTTLPKTKYKFESGQLQEYAAKFISELKDCDELCKKEGIQYIPLKKIARAIQS